MERPEMVETPPDSQPRMEHRWRMWIAENKIQNLDDGVIVDVLSRNGTPPNATVAELRELYHHPYFQAAHNLQQLTRKLESILGVYRTLESLSPNAGKIETQRRIGRNEFLEDFYCRNRPLLLTQMMKKWKALTAWTPEYLKQKLGDVDVEVQTGRDSDPMYERNLEQHRQRMPFSQYVDLVEGAGETNDFYMVANNKNFDRSGPMQALIDDTIQFPELIDAGNWKDKMFFWYGPKGTITPLHHDPMNVLLCQVSGRKRVRLISPDQTPFMYNYVGVFSEVDDLEPDYDRYPLYRHVRPLEFILEPGQCVFIPVGWWHAVVSLEKSISVSMTHFAFPNTFTWQNPHLVR